MVKEYDPKDWRCKKIITYGANVWPLAELSSGYRLAFGRHNQLIPYKPPQQPGYLH